MDIVKHRKGGVQGWEGFAEEVGEEKGMRERERESTLVLSLCPPLAQV